MNKSYDVYAFAIETLNDVLDSIIVCQKKLIDGYQSEIDAIKNDASLDETTRQNKLNNYLTSIERNHNLLKENNRIINAMSDDAETLSSNMQAIFSLPTNLSQENEDLSSKARELKKEIESQVDKLLSVITSAREVINHKDDANSDASRILEIECHKLHRLTDEVDGMLDGITFDAEGTSDPSVKEAIYQIAHDEQERAKEISEIALGVINSNISDFIRLRKLRVFYAALEEEYNKILEQQAYVNRTVMELSAKNITSLDRIVLVLLQEVIEEEERRVGSSLKKFATLVAEEDKNNEAEIDAYNEKIREVLENLVSGKKDIKEIVSELTKQVESDDDLGYSNAHMLEQKEEEKKHDSSEYKKHCTLLNKSFWEARSKAANENIKYPSALYEQKVKEYQNDFLITNYNISLEEIEDAITEYKEKYAEDVYMDELYNKALTQLRQESSASIQELCEEKGGLSYIDKRVFKLLEFDLEDTIRAIKGVKEEENIDDSVAVSEYRRSLKISKLIDHRDIIEHQLDLLRKREIRLQKEEY